MITDQQDRDRLQYADAAEHGDEAVRSEGAYHQQPGRKR